MSPAVQLGIIIVRIVKKFGGTSVADLDRIRNVAEKVKRAVDEGHEVAVVVSAMSGTTNQLVEYCDDVSAIYDAREYDVVVSAGEQISAGLTAMTLQSMGVTSRSWLGWQIPFETSDVHGAARIENIHDRGASEAHGARRGSGRGRTSRASRRKPSGSRRWGAAARTPLRWRWRRRSRPISATSIPMSRASIPAIRASSPRPVSWTRLPTRKCWKWRRSGAKVLQTRSVALAMKEHVRTQVLSSFEDTPGTLVVDEDEIVEQEVVSGIAYSKDDAKVTVSGVADRPGVSAAIFGPLADAAINVDMIVQNVSQDGLTDMTFTVPRGELKRAIKQIEAQKDAIGYKSLSSDPNVVKISVIGVGMRSHAGVASRMFRTLAEKGINIQVISTSEIKVSVLIASEYTELALRALHTAYDLDAA